ncbi:MAG: 3-phosphoshikimate 1-carboxyvinyltransferase [Clostridia bacterium]|nr:3-phosphoshikimate 1-carboxyvinyltransferase [Clostridia bacterium]
MIVTIEKSTAFGEITAPPSKSMAHRYLICGANTSKSVIENVDFSEDIKATLNCLKALGAEVSIDGNTVTIGGLSEERKINSKLYCGESGSTLRFLIPFCMLRDEEIVLEGTKRLFERSLSVYEEMCKAQDIKFEKTETSVAVKGKLSSGRYNVRGDISSQFISGLMMTLPLLSGESVIDIKGKSESASYLALTLKSLADFGVRISKIDENTMYVKGEQTYKNRNLSVEGDYSNAAFFDAFNLIGGNVAVTGLDEKSVQGDRVYKKIFPLLLKGCPVVDICDCPDLAPVLMALGAALKGIILTGTKRLKIKESDRSRAMAEELAKFGCKVDVEEDIVKVFPCKLQKPILPLSSHNDHRIVMAISLLCTLTGGRIYGAEAVSKSLPDFFHRLKKLGVNLKVENE